MVNGVYWIYSDGNSQTILARCEGTIGKPHHHHDYHYYYYYLQIENMYSVFLSSYKNTRESLGELEKAVETLASISRFPKLPLVLL